MKNIKKANRSISEYFLPVKAIADSLLAIGDPISEQDQIDAVLDVLPKEYNSFVMMVYGRPDSPSLSDIEALLLVQEAQLDKFRQELVVSNVSANIAQTSNGQGQASNFSHGEQSQNSFVPRGGRGRGGHGRGRGRDRGGGGNGNRPTCQLCKKYGHDTYSCWHRFEEDFIPSQPP